MFCLNFLGHSGKHQCGKQDNPTNTKENPADRKIRQTLVKDNPANKTIWGVWSFPTCLFVGVSFVKVCRIVQYTEPGHSEINKSNGHLLAMGMQFVLCYRVNLKTFWANFILILKKDLKWWFLQSCKKIYTSVFLGLKNLHQKYHMWFMTNSIPKRLKTVWNSHRHRHFWFPAVVKNIWFFTPAFITFSTRIFTPVGNSLH